MGYDGGRADNLAGDMLVGPTHSHSTISFDGKVELDALQQFYSERGNDFCLMSEHIEGLNTDAIEQMLARYRALPERRCLMIPGIEIDDLHILIYGVERAHPFQSYEDLAAKYYEDGAFIVVSHPAKIHGPLPDVIHPWIRGVEVWNSRHDGRHNPRDKSVELWRELHRADPRVVPLGAMDFHSTPTTRTCRSVWRHRASRATSSTRFARTVT